MNPFTTLRAVQEAYRSYVESFQHFKTAAIRDWVAERVEKGSLLWRDPYIELTRRFERGENLQELVKAGVLYAGTPSCFTVEGGDRDADPVSPHRHQSLAVRALLEKKRNIIVATGTGSGKSFCFGIPIVGECLRMRDQGHVGIKAVIIYPMNALANSQYDDLALRLRGSGLKLALYTGDTKSSDEGALAEYRQVFGRDPYDSEVISREQIRCEVPGSTPPDILMTNYQMLELLLTRFEDRRLFPPEHAGTLLFLVLDEVHTYTGKRGADVACLIRRLKQHTGTIGKLRCIGTSATVQSGEGEDARQLIASFASRLFGEPFVAEDVIGEEYVEHPKVMPVPLSASVGATDEMIESFDGSVGSAAQLVGTLVGRQLTPAEQTPEGLGILLADQATAWFLEERLTERVETLTALAEAYQEQWRPEAALEECRRELAAALLAGMVARIPVHEQMEPRFVVKLHAFFAQGRPITACLTGDLHLSDRGETRCPECADRERDIATFPLHFCRACGQEFYGASVQPDGTLEPRDIDQTDMEGVAVYVFPAEHDADVVAIPDNWLTPKGNVKKAYEDVVPRNTKYCPECNVLNPSCSHASLAVSIVPVPLLLCPSCGVSYDRRIREFNKLFTFGSVGRSTATDVITEHILANVDLEERKLIAFSDNRQDTALQAAHINSLQQRLHFRRSLYRALEEEGCIVGSDRTIPLREIGPRIFKVQRDAGKLPDYGKTASKYHQSTGADAAYQRYLEFLTLLELQALRMRTHLNLEDVGLLVVDYDGLAAFAADEGVWRSTPVLSTCTAEVREDYLRGLLDIMRGELAINHPWLNRREEFELDIQSKLREELFVDVGPGRPVGFSDDADNDTRTAEVLRITGSPALKNWTRRALELSSTKEAVPVIEAAVAALKSQDAGFLSEEHIKFAGHLLMVEPSVITLQIDPATAQHVCKKCGSVRHLKVLDWCTRTACLDRLVSKDLGHNYFRLQYMKPLGDCLPIAAEEHSGQIDGDTRKDIEARFRDAENPLNVLVCTPTMELGIDIGALSAVYMRNVPPSPSHYAQRAGRSGRKGQASLVTTFCGVGTLRGPHDQYFYRNPEKIVAGRIAPPRFLLDNQALVRTHIHSLVLETIGIKLPSQSAEILNLAAEAYPLFEDLGEKLQASIAGMRPKILAAVNEAFKEEIAQFNEWFTASFVEGVVERFVGDLDRAYERWRIEYRRLDTESDDLNQKAKTKSLNAAESARRSAVEAKMTDMREGKKDFYTYRYLGAEGFLPNYAFPRIATTLSFLRRSDDISRDQVLALREYAPLNSVYYRGNRHEVSWARPRTQQNQPAFQTLLICKACHAAYLNEEATLAACAHCGTPLTDRHPNPHALEMPDVLSRPRARITADEEERTRLGYIIDGHYRPGMRVQQWDLRLDGEVVGRLSYEHNAKVVVVNEGFRLAEMKDQQAGFALCTLCNQWLGGDDSVASHIGKGSPEKACRRGAQEKDIPRNVVLYVDAAHDAVTLDIAPLGGLADTEGFYRSLLYAMSQGLQVALDVDESEIDGLVIPKPSEPGRCEVMIYETAEGGTGAVQALTQLPRLRQVLAAALEILHDGDPNGCERACYDCLCSFYNQRYHELLDRHLVLPVLRRVAGAELASIVASVSLEGLLQQAGSELEREVFRAIARSGLPLPDAGQEPIWDGDEPVAKTDFFYRPRLVGFVDGSPHYLDYVQAGDETKRRRLRALGYVVVVIKGDDIGAGLSELRMRLGL
jgi:ATP-dependent helicase YprA (DUF1998 family)